MDTDKYFEELEELLPKLRKKDLPADIKLTITYSTGEKDTFNVTIAFWANSMVGTKNKKKHLYYKGKLINMDHVVKMEYEGLDEYMYNLKTEVGDSNDQSNPSNL